MKVDEDILKKDLLQLLSEMELFDYYRGSKKLHLNSFSFKSADIKTEGDKVCRGMRYRVDIFVY